MTPPTKIIHRVVVAGLMLCGAKERITGSRGTLANRYVNCTACLAALRAKQDAAARRRAGAGA